MLLLGRDVPAMEAQAEAIVAAGHPEPAIVALTANALGGDRERCMAAGCDAYLTKPVAPRELATTLEKAMRERKAAA